MVTACSGDRNMAGRRSAERSDTVNTPAAAAGFVRGPTVVFFGTSLTAGYGLDPADAYPVTVARLADSAGTPINAVNAGLSGETSAGAERRIDWVLRGPADVIVLETGANDALRGQDPNATRANIERVVEAARRDRPNAAIVLVQMEAPPNLGSAYAREFHDMYAEIASKERVHLMPFLLNGVAGISALNQADGIHPNRAGERIVASNVWKSLAPIVKSLQRARVERH